MASVYILYSKAYDSFYTGFTTESIAVRIQRHNEGYYDDKFTRSGKPWELFLEIPCASEGQARAIEKHVKSMKSRRYIENLKAYPEMIQKLLDRFPDS